MLANTFRVSAPRPPLYVARPLPRVRLPATVHAARADRLPARESLEQTLYAANRQQHGAPTHAASWATHLARALRQYNVAENKLQRVHQRADATVTERRKARQRVRDELRVMGWVLQRCDDGTYGDVPRDGMPSTVDLVRALRALRRQELASPPPSPPPLAPQRFWLSEALQQLEDAPLVPAQTMWINTMHQLVADLVAAESTFASAVGPATVAHQMALFACLRNVADALQDIPTTPAPGPAWVDLWLKARTYILGRARELTGDL